MTPLRPTECISPAIARTKLVLFTPFRKGRTWKLAATAYLCRIGTICFPFPLIYLLFLPLALHAGKTAAVILVTVVLAITALALFLFYLGSRLQFAFFDIVVNRGEFLAPAWRKYSRQSLPWTGSKILFGAIATLVCALPAALYIRHIIPMFADMPAFTPGQPPPSQTVSAVLGLYAAYFAFLFILGLFYLISSLLSDFVIPSLALEDTGLKEAFRRMTELIRRESGAVTVYILLKVALAFVTYFGVTIVWELIFLFCTLIVGIVVAVIGFLLQLAGVSSGILTAIAICLAVLWFLFFTFYTLTFAMGVTLTFLDAYALYFLGGRYPMLGDLLDRSTPPPTYVVPLPGHPPPYSAPPLPEHNPNS